MLWFKLRYRASTSMLGPVNSILAILRETTDAGQCWETDLILLLLSSSHIPGTPQQARLRMASASWNIPQAHHCHNKHQQEIQVPWPLWVPFRDNLSSRWAALWEGMERVECEQGHGKYPPCKACSNLCTKYVLKHNSVRVRAVQAPLKILIFRLFLICTSVLGD